jgi:hypothetical protein
MGVANNGRGRRREVSLSAGLFRFFRGRGFFHFPKRYSPASCRAEGIRYATLTSTVFGLASSFLAITTRKTPSLYSAVTWAGSAKAGNVKLRRNSP